MNEQHVIAAIITAGLLAQKKEETATADAVALYMQVLGDYVEANRPQRGPRPAAQRRAGQG